MIAPAAVQKIAAILPRLSSPHDGEVLATVNAIGRVLASTKSDWHDVTQAFERGATALESHRQQKPQPASQPQDHEEERTPPTWAGLTSNERERWLRAIVARAHLSSWEMDFAASILGKFHSCGRTEKQIAVLDHLLAKAFWEGVRI